MSFKIPNNTVATRNSISQGKPIRSHGLVMVSTSHNRNHQFKPYNKLPVLANRSLAPVTHAISSNNTLTPKLPIVNSSYAMPSTSSSNTRPSTSSIPVEVDKPKRIFSKELRCMMYGFGDDRNPYTESVDMIEDLVLQFISDIAIQAFNFGANERISIEDLSYILRNDPKKFSRLKDLLDMNNELRQARKAFDEVKYIEQ